MHVTWSKPVLHYAVSYSIPPTVCEHAWWLYDYSADSCIWHNETSLTTKWIAHLMNPLAEKTGQLLCVSYNRNKFASRDLFNLSLILSCDSMNKNFLEDGLRAVVCKLNATAIKRYPRLHFNISAANSLFCITFSVEPVWKNAEFLVG